MLQKKGVFVILFLMGIIIFSSLISAGPTDLNNDGKIDFNDIKIVINHILGISLNLQTDINGDGNVNIFDLVLVAKEWGTSPPPPPPSGSLPSGLVLAYGFDEGTGTQTTDSSGNGNTGTINGATWTTGKYGGGLSFDGVNDWVDAGSSTTTDDIRPVTYTMWVNPNTLTGYLISKRDTCAGYWRLDSSPGWFKGFTGTNPQALTEPLNTLPTNTWTHLVLTWDGTINPAKIYLNGIETSYTTQTTGSGTPLPDDTCTLRIGSREGTSAFYNGLIDEVRIYNRVLSLSEITQDMNNRVSSCTDGATQTCGTNVGACNTGTQTCNIGTWSNCNGETTQTKEICNGIDDNCNGQTDEGGVCVICGDGSCDSAQGETCASCSTDCGTCTTPPPPPSGGITHPNEPAGFTRFYENNYTIAPLYGIGNDNGAAIDGCWWKGGNGANVGVSNDPTAPSGDNSVLDIRFPVGHPSGVGPGKVQEWDLCGESSNTEYSKVYFDFWFKMAGGSNGDLSNWEQHPVLTKILGFWGSGRNNQGAVAADMYGMTWNDNSGNLFQTAWPLVWTQSFYPPGGRGYSQNTGSGEKIVVGQWQKIEILLEMNSVPGSTDGKLKIWIDNTLVTNYADVSYNSPTSPSGFYGRHNSPTYGGLSTVSKTREDHIYYDHMYMSGVL